MQIFNCTRGQYPNPLVGPGSTALGRQLMNTFTQMQADPFHLHVHALGAHVSTHVNTGCLWASPCSQLYPAVAAGWTCTAPGSHKHPSTGWCRRVCVCVCVCVCGPTRAEEEEFPPGGGGRAEAFTQGRGTPQCHQQTTAGPPQLTASCRLFCLGRNLLGFWLKHLGVFSHNLAEALLPSNSVPLGDGESQV